MIKQCKRMTLVITDTLKCNTREALIITHYDKTFVITDTLRIDAC